MCDFRNISKIQLDTGEIVSTNFVRGVYPHELFAITTPGLYYIIATGSSHLYFDGSEWLVEHEPYYEKYNIHPKFRQGYKVLEFSVNYHC